MNNPFDLIDVRLSNIEALLLDIKHRTIHETERTAINIKTGKPPINGNDSIATLDLDVRAFNALVFYFENGSKATVNDFVNMDFVEFGKIRGVGRATLKEVSDLRKEILKNA